MDVAALKVEVATACGETDAIDFKSTFDSAALRDWVETVKDIVAMHNSGGGVIVFGLNSDGSDAGTGGGIQGAVDPAHVPDKVRRYTGQTIHGIVFERFEKNGRAYDGWIIPGAPIPVPFKEPGTWEKPDRKQETVFSRGQLYFRHGAKSEFAAYDDMVAWTQRIADAARRKMYEDMGSLVTVPDGHRVAIIPAGATVPVPTVTDCLRITDDPTAPGCVVLDKFKTHPHRQKDLIARLTTRLPGCKFDQFDVQCIRKIYGSEIEAKGLIYHPPHSAAYFSDGLSDWIAGKIGEDPAFLEKTRAACKKGAA